VRTTSVMGRKPAPGFINWSDSIFLNLEFGFVVGMYGIPEVLCVRAQMDTRFLVLGCAM